MKLDTFNNSWYYPGGVIKRTMWYFVSAIFFNSYLIPFNGVKCFLLRFFGATIGEKVVIKPKVNIKYPWNINIGNNVWIGANCSIVAGVKIGNNVTIGAGCTIRKNIPSNTIVIHKENQLSYIKKRKYLWKYEKEVLN